MSFEYEPLDRNKAQIRLLRLRPSSISSTFALDLSDSDPTEPGQASRIHGSVIHVDLDSSDCPKFNALSYTWGPSSNPQTILIDGKFFEVSQNLGEFLSVAVSDSKFYDDFLWIDQICIDQKSTTDRNHQVRAMGQIYATAQNVFAWLGPADDEISVLMQRLNGNKKFDLEQINDFYEQRVVSLSSLLARDYWSRLWIIQEVVLAGSLFFVCGRDMIHVQVLGEYIRFVIQGLTASVEHSLTDRQIEGNDNAEQRSTLAHLRRVRQLYDVRDATWMSANSFAPTRRDGRYFKIFSLCAEAHCSDSRDMVYGVMGLMPENDQVQINYHWNSLQVFMQAADHYRDVRDTTYDYYRPSESAPRSPKQANFYAYETLINHFPTMRLYERMLGDQYYKGEKPDTFGHISTDLDYGLLLGHVIEGTVKLNDLLSCVLVDRDHEGEVIAYSEERGKTFDSNAKRPELTCETLRQACTYIYSWMPDGLTILQSLDHRRHDIRLMDEMELSKATLRLGGEVPVDEWLNTKCGSRWYFTGSLDDVKKAVQSV